MRYRAPSTGIVRTWCFVFCQKSGRGCMGGSVRKRWNVSVGQYSRTASYRRATQQHTATLNLFCAPRSSITQPSRQHLAKHFQVTSDQTEALILIQSTAKDAADERQQPTQSLLTTMRLGLALIPLAFVAPSCAQYFSTGWTPGQAVPTEASSTPSFAPETTPLPPPRQGESRFSLSYILSNGPISQLFNRFGVNVTERLEAAKANSEIWDSRIPLITDDNYNDLIVNEVLTTEEERDRVWFLVM
jgi:hypothetical protein